jgi:hypothetical protein
MRDEQVLTIYVFIGLNLETYYAHKINTENILEHTSVFCGVSTIVTWTITKYSSKQIMQFLVETNIK